MNITLTYALTLRYRLLHYMAYAISLLPPCHIDDMPDTYIYAETTISLRYVNILPPRATYATLRLFDIAFIISPLSLLCEPLRYRRSSLSLPLPLPHIFARQRTFRLPPLFAAAAIITHYVADTPLRCLLRYAIEKAAITLPPHGYAAPLYMPLPELIFAATASLRD